MLRLHKTVQDILNMKKEKKKISVITSYDYTLASLCDKAGIDVLDPCKLTEGQI